MTDKATSGQAPRTPGKPNPGHGRQRPERSYGTADERGYKVLVGKLHALDRDIASAKATSQVSVGDCLLSVRRSDKPTARLEGDEVKLADGAHILIRPIEPDDAVELEHALQRLGALSRYEHLLTDTDHLDKQRLAAETHADHTTRETLIALDPTTGEAIALARYLRDPNDPIQAEIAGAVTDHWQRRGVGTALAKRLAVRARENGVEHLTARLLVGNERGRRLLGRVADIVSEERDGGAIDITARLRHPDKQPTRATARPSTEARARRTAPTRQPATLSKH